jgi:hypothetical protein
MKKSISANALEPWRDPLDLIDALVEIPKEELHSLRASIYTLIRHHDRDVRVHACRRLFVHLEAKEHHADAVDLLRYDSEPKVRRVAAFAVAATSSAGSRSEDVGLLTRVLLNASEALMVRGAAYEALLLLHSRRDFPPIDRDIDLARDVDWEWVKTLGDAVGAP